jgi:phenylacetate-CoA ligase
MTQLLDGRHQVLRAEAIAEMEYVSSLDRTELAPWQLAQLNATLERAYANSPFYRELRRYWGLPSRLPSLDVLARFPFTTKEDLRNQYPFGFLAVPPEELVRYGESTGTSGRPTSAFITYEDWIRGNVWVERALRSFFDPSDTVFIAIPYELTFASYDLDRALEQLGAAVVPVGTLNQVCPFQRLVDMMATVHPTALVCTPSRALRLYDLLRERGHDPAAVGLRTLLYVGETCAPSRLEKISRALNVRLVTAYGSTETNSLGLPCEHGACHLVEGRHYFEVVDPVSGSRVPAGGEGELVLTSLRTRAMPLIRYRTGDRVRVREEPCPCGAAGRVLEHQGRVAEGLRVGRREIPKLDLEEVVLSTPGTGVYYVAGARDGAVRVLVEVEDGAALTCRTVAEAVRAAFDVPAEVEPVARTEVTAAMDRMLKPGSLALDDLEVAA